MQKKASQVTEFQKADKVKDSCVNASYNTESLRKAMSAATNVPLNKVFLHAEILSGVTGNNEQDPANTYTEYFFANLTEQECLSLRDYHSQGLKRPSEVDCKRQNRNYFTADFVAAPIQALIKHRFAKQKVKSGEIEAKIIANCWTTSYEVTRHRATGNFDYTVFYAGDVDIEKYFQDTSYFQNVGENPSSGSFDYLLKIARPGDLVQLYKDRIYHSLVWVAPGLLFEKTGPQTAWTYRFVLLEDVLATWGGIQRVTLLRPTGKALPHPHLFLGGEMGGNSRNEGTEDEYTFMVQIPPFVKAGDGRYHLPPAAYQTSTYQLTEVAGRPPVCELKRSEESVFLTCTTLNDATAYGQDEEGRPTTKVEGVLPKGSILYAGYRINNHYQAASLTLNGQLRDSRMGNSVWFEIKDLSCKPRE
jgi:hypothetical protein